MRFKKPAAFLLALLTMLASVSVASAANEYSTVITAECLLPDVMIQVVVPTESQVYVNPQSLPVRVDGKIVKSQIISEPSCIENQSEVPLAVTTSVTGTIKSGSDMFLSSTSTHEVSTTIKKAFIYFEMKASDSSDVTQVEWDDAYDENNHILVRTTAKAKKNYLILGAKDTQGSFGAFRLAGDCVANPRIPWTVEDGVDVNVTFTFTPVSGEN